MVEINKLRKRNVTLILLIVLIVQINGINCDNRPRGGYPYPSRSGWYASEEIKSDFFCFLFCDSESTKKKRFENRRNVCKWLKNLYQHYSASFKDHFKPIKNVLAVKTAKIQAFENLKSFYWILNILNGKNHGHVDHVHHVSDVQRVDHVQHVDHVRHVNQVQHVDQIQHVNQVQHVNHVQHVDQVQYLDHIQHVDQV
jgi:hypothetical protein